MKIVIRAGGVGSRLWPVSREKQPKQFHPFTSAKTLLQEAIERVRPIAPYSDIFVSINSDVAEMVKVQYQDIPAENVIVEPARKDTAAAIGLESIMIHKRDPQAVVASLGSDHSVRRVDEFQRILKLTAKVVQQHPQNILAVGIKPTRPDTGYGYIQCGEVIDTVESENIWQVDRFSEKPSKQEARQFLEKTFFLWNANMFVWNVSTILELYKQHLPQMYEQLMIIDAALGTAKQQETISRVYPQLEKIAIDYAIIAKTDKVLAMAADIGWSDIGDWARLKDELAESEEQNVVISARHIGIKTANTIIHSSKNKVIATIGIENLVIVDTDDALLICDKYKSAEVKQIVQQLRDKQWNDVL